MYIEIKWFTAINSELPSIQTLFPWSKEMELIVPGVYCVFHVLIANCASV